MVKKIEQLLRSIGVRHKLGYAQVWLRSLLNPPPPKGNFPSVSVATTKPNGLVAIGGKLTDESLMAAYRQGIYPMFYKLPVKWWSGEVRMVLKINEMRREKNLFRIVRSGRFRVTFDSAFTDVMKGCSDRSRTWITPEVIAAYSSLHKKGNAHSVEVWNLEGELVGGLYGVDYGAAFGVESLFAKTSNASKVAMLYLFCHMQHWGYNLIDAQTPGELFRSFRAEVIPRDEFIAMISVAPSNETRVGTWQVDEALNVGTWIPAEPGSQRCADPTR